MNKQKYLYRRTRQFGCAVLTVLLFEGVGYAQQRPFSWWGELGYDFLSNQFESGDDRIEHTGLFRINATGFVHEPWLAIYDGGLGMYYRRSESDAIDSTSDSLNGDLNLRLFPRSRFPLQAFVEKSDTRTDTDLTQLVIDRFRYGLNQSYVSRGGASMNIGYEHTDQTNVSTDRDSGDTVREDSSDLFRARFNKAFGAHNISFNANANYVDIVNSIDATDTAFATLRHAYRPSPTFSSEDMLTYNTSSVVTSTSSFETEVVQFNSFGFWRPRTERPLRINGTIRALTSENQFRSDVVEAQSATATLGGTYEWTRRLLFNANAGVTNTEADDEMTTTHFQSISTIYNSEVRKVFDLDATWFGQLELRNTDDDGDRLQEAGAQLGYNLNKIIPRDNKHTYNFGARQTIATTTDSDDFSTLRLLSNAFLGWNRRGVRSNGMARFSISDTRTFASGIGSENFEGEFQLINLQASVDSRLSSTSAFRANVTMQATRQERPPIPGVISESDGKWRPTSTINMTYYKLGVFGAPRLSFFSTLRSIRNAYAPVVGEQLGEDARDLNQWENRLEYTVGRLQLRAISRLSSVQGEKQNYFLFQARRFIGGY